MAKRPVCGTVRGPGFSLLEEEEEEERQHLLEEEEEVMENGYW